MAVGQRPHRRVHRTGRGDVPVEDEVGDEGAPDAKLLAGAGVGEQGGPGEIDDPLRDALLAAMVGEDQEPRDGDLALQGRGERRNVPVRAKERLEGAMQRIEASVLVHDGLDPSTPGAHRAALVAVRCRALERGSEERDRGPRIRHHLGAGPPERERRRLVGPLRQAIEEARERDPRPFLPEAPSVSHR